MQPDQPGEPRGEGARRPRTRATGSEVSTPVSAADMPRPSLMSPRTGPTLTAAGRRLNASTTMPRTTRTALRDGCSGPQSPSIVSEDLAPAVAGCRGGCEDRPHARRHRRSSAARAWRRRHALAQPGRLGRGGGRADDLPARHRAGRASTSRRSRAPRSPGRRRPGALRRASVVKQLAMRRTLFAFPRDLLPAVWGSASARVAGQLRDPPGQGGGGQRHRRRRGHLAHPHLRRRAPRLRDEGPATTAELRERIPALARRLELSPGQGLRRQLPDRAPRCWARWRRADASCAVPTPVTGASPGRAWTLTEDWLGRRRCRHAEVGYRIRVWSSGGCAPFGPGTEADLVWWLGATKGAVRRALGDLERRGGRARR